MSMMLCRRAAAQLSHDGSSDSSTSSTIAVLQQHWQYYSSTKAALLSLVPGSCSIVKLKAQVVKSRAPGLLYLSQLWAMPSVIPLAGPAEKPVPEVYVLAMSQDEKRLWKCERRSYRIACKWIACVDAYLFCRDRKSVV